MTVDEYRYEAAPEDAHLTAIGRVVVESAILENVVEGAIWRLMGGRREVSELMTDRPDLGVRVAMLTKLFPLAFPNATDQRELTVIATELRAMVGVRNHLLHAFWTTGVRPEQPVTVNPRDETGAIVPRTKKWDAAEIERIAARISRVCDELVIFLDVHGVSVPPLVNRPWTQYKVPPEPDWPSKSGRETRQRPPPFVKTKSAD